METIFGIKVSVVCNFPTGSIGIINNGMQMIDFLRDGIRDLRFLRTSAPCLCFHRQECGRLPLICCR